MRMSSQPARFIRYCLSGFLILLSSNLACFQNATSAQITDPRDLNGNVLWLDGSDVDGDFVAGGSFLNGTTWVDKSTAQFASASQSAAASLPTIVTLFNGLTSVDFDGNDFMDVDNGAFGMLRNVQSATIIGVLSTELDTNNRALRALMISSGANSAATRAGISLFDTFGTSIGGSGEFGLAGRRLDSDGFERIEGGDVAAGELASMAGVFDYQAGELTLFVNGEAQTSVDSFQTPGNTSDTDSLNIRIGADAALNMPRGFYNGQIAELIVYDRALSATELADVEAYIAQKWRPALLGDCNLDGVVNFQDIQPFIDILSSQSFLAQADCNQDGMVNFLDIQPFIDILSQQ